MFWRIALIFSVIWFVPSCSSRVEYSTVANVGPATSGMVNINTASVEELEKLPHIGRKTAETIVRFREENGPFRRPEHLMQVRGVSEARYVEIRQFLTTE